MKTRDQEFAKKSYDAVSARINRCDTNQKEYRSFAKRLPTLIHTCGLMQAMAFALAKNGMQLSVLEDFVAVMQSPQVTANNFARQCQDAEMPQYMHTSRLAMLAAGWIKRQTDALIEGD